MKKQINRKIEFKNWTDFSPPRVKLILDKLSSVLESYLEHTGPKSRLTGKITIDLHESFEVTKRNPLNHYYVEQKITDLTKDEFLNMLENYDAGRVFLSAPSTDNISIDFLPCIRMVAISASGDPLFVHKILTCKPDLMRLKMDNGRNVGKCKGKTLERRVGPTKSRFSSFLKHPIVAPIIVLLILSVLAIIGLYDSEAQIFDFKRLLEWFR